MAGIYRDRGQRFLREPVRVTSIIRAISEKLGSSAWKTPSFASPFSFTQLSPSSVWQFTHNLGREPVGVEVIVGGQPVIAGITHLDANTIKISFNSARSGKVLFV